MKDPAREGFAVWAGVIGALALVQIAGLAVPLLHAVVGALAVAAFLYVPSVVLEKRGQDAHDAGWRFDGLRRDLLWSLGACAVVLPLFALGFVGFTSTLDRLPEALRSLLAPYIGRAHALHFSVPLDLDFLGKVAGNAAVAFAEEFFYRGYLTMRFEEKWPPKHKLLGAPFGLAAVLAAVLFALGHLLEPAPWRLAVFFPALLFAWLRARTGTIVGASVAHLLSNVWLLLLERAAY